MLSWKRFSAVGGVVCIVVVVDDELQQFGREFCLISTFPVRHGSKCVRRRGHRG